MLDDLFRIIKICLSAGRAATQTDKQMASTFSHWPHSNFDLGSAYVPLPETVLNDLMADEAQDISTLTSDWATELMNDCLYSGNGFFILDGSSYQELDPDQRIHLTKRLAPCLGNPIVHHSKHLKQDLVTNVKDAGVRFTSSKDQNFSSSNQEAIEHTESTELPNPIGAFLLHNIQPAYKGGANRFVNAYTLLDRLAEIDPANIDVLRRPFFFDTARGERVESPIVSYDDQGNLDFRWMYAFIENGRPYTKHWDDQVQSVIDATLSAMEELRITVTLARGDIIVVNNRMMLHARDAFENHPDHPPRWLLRTWFK